MNATKIAMPLAIPALIRAWRSRSRIAQQRSPAGAGGSSPVRGFQPPDESLLHERDGRESRDRDSEQRPRGQKESGGRDVDGKQAGAEALDQPPRILFRADRPPDEADDQLVPVERVEGQQAQRSNRDVQERQSEQGGRQQEGGTKKHPD